MTKSFPAGTINKRGREAKRDKTKIEVGNSVTVKVRETDENIREG